MTEPIQIDGVEIVLYPYSLITQRRTNNLYWVHFFEDFEALSEELGYDVDSINATVSEFCKVSARVQSGDLPFELAQFVGGDVVDDKATLHAKYKAYLAGADYDLKTAVYVAILNSEAPQDPALVNGGSENTNPKGKRGAKKSKKSSTP